MLKDILGQAWEAMLYNRRRTAITMIGMAWGIATVVLLLAYGAGFSRAIETIFAQWGTNTIGFFPGRTSEQAGGDKAGVKVRFTLDDVDRVQASVPGITHISPIVYYDSTVRNELHTYAWTVAGIRPAFQDIINAAKSNGVVFGTMSIRAASSAAPRISSAPTSASSPARPRPSSFPASGR